LQKYFTFRLTEIDSHKEFEADLESSNVYDLIVFDEEISEEFNDFYQSHQLKIPTLMITRDKEKSTIDDIETNLSQINQIANCDQVEKYVFFVSKILNINFKFSSTEKSDSYIQIGLNLIKQASELPFDTFIRLKSGHKKFKYTKIAGKGEVLSASLVDKYQEEPLFIQTKDYEKLFNYVMDDEELSKSLEDELLETSFLVDLIPYFIYELNSNVGLIQQTTNKIIENFVSLSMKKSEAYEVFQQIFKNKLSLRFQNTYLRILFMTQIFERRRDLKKNTLEKLILISTFSDISLEDESYFSIMSQEHEHFKELSIDEKNHILNHAYHSYEQNKDIIKKLTHHKIQESILFHHGSRDGKGFYKNNIQEFSEFDQAFIIISFYVANYLRPGEPITTKTAFSYVRKQFDIDLKEYECLI
jgi:hypothetical protein